MTKGKYNRKRENAQKLEKQSHPSNSLGQEEGSNKLDTDNNAANVAEKKRQPKPSWPSRGWNWVKRDYVTAVSVAVFTGVLAVVSIFQGWVMRTQLSEMQKAQRPFVFTSANLGNNWISDSEHDIQVTISVRNLSAYPAVNSIASHPKIWMGATSSADEVIKHCDIEYI